MKAVSGRQRWLRLSSIDRAVPVTLCVPPPSNVAPKAEDGRRVRSRLLERALVETQWMAESSVGGVHTSGDHTSVHWGCTRVPLGEHNWRSQSRIVIAICN